MTEKLNTAMTTAQAKNKAVWVPFKGGVLSSSVEIKASLQGPGRELCGFTTTISDGSPTLYADDVNGLRMDGFSVKGNVPDADTTGIKLGSYDDNQRLVRRSRMTDVLVSRCGTGIEWRGHINDMESVLIIDCATGAKFAAQNGSRIGVITENNEQDFQMKDSLGLVWPVMLMEGSRSRHKDASTMDNVRNLDIGAFYAEYGGEGVENAPWLHIGKDTLCKNIRIGVADLREAAVEAIVVDKVTGFDMKYAAYTQISTPYVVTTAATDVVIQDLT